MHDLFAKAERLPGLHKRNLLSDPAWGCGLCVSTCPEVFTMTDGGTAAAAPADVTGPDEAAATDAMQTCPVGAIESVDG